MKRSGFCYAISTLLFLLVSGLQNASGQQLFKNGDFNATTSYYTTACTSVEATYYESTYGGSSTTNHVAEVDDESCFYQDVCVLPGASYIFSMDASRRSSTITPNPLTSHLKITGLDASLSVVATYVDMDFTRTNTTFAFTAVTGIPVINVASGSGVVKLRVQLTDNTTGYSTYGMIVDNLSLTFSTPPTVVGPDTVCQNSAVTFSASGIASTGISYLWSFGAGASPTSDTVATPTATWATTGTKIVTVVLGNGVCYVDTVNYSFNVRGSVQLTIYDSICSNSSYNFNGRVLDSTGTYVDSLSSVTGCDSIITLNLYVKQVPSRIIISGRSTYCIGDVFVPITTTGTGVLWYASPSGGTGSPTAPTVSTASAGTSVFYANATNMGCEGPRSSFSVTVYENPLADFNYDITYNCSRDIVAFTNACQFTTSYLWDFGDGSLYKEKGANPTHYYTPVFTPTSISVKLYAFNSNCPVDSITKTFTLNPATFPRFLTNVTADQTIQHGNSIQLNASGGTIYYWTPSDGSLSNPNINNPIATPDDSTTYTVYAYNELGCKDSASVKIALNNTNPISIPTAFTPNGDGLNDVFRIGHHKFSRLAEFSIYNKWGQRVFFTSDISQGWDGTFNGVPQDMGTYKYLIIMGESEGSANRTYTGDVTLVR